MKKGKALVKPDAKTHSEWAASKSSIWMNCAGSIRETRKIPAEMRGGSSVHADKGTAAHHLLEHCLTEDLDAVDCDDQALYVFDNGGVVMQPYAKAPPKGFKHEFFVDRDMHEAVQVAIDYVRRRLEELGPDARMELEVQCVPFAKVPNMYGTSDVVLSLWPDVIEVIDYKHGSGVWVGAENNSQMRYYAHGAARREGFEHSKVITTIVQPRCPQGGEVVRSEEMSMKELKRWGEKLWAAFEASQRKDAPLTPGKHCEWCEVARSNRCDALRKQVVVAAKADWDAVERDEQPKQPRLPVGPSEIAKAMKMAPMIKAWLDGVNRAAYDLARRNKLPGFKVVAKKSNRKLRDDMKEKELIAAICKKFKLKPADLYGEAKLLSAAQLEAKLDKADRAEFNKRFVVKPPGSPTLAPADDPREAIAFNEAADYDEVGLDE